MRQSFVTRTSIVPIHTYVRGLQDIIKLRRVNDVRCKELDRDKKKLIFNVRIVKTDFFPSPKMRDQYQDDTDLDLGWASLSGKFRGGQNCICRTPVHTRILQEMNNFYILLHIFTVFGILTTKYTYSQKYFLGLLNKQ